MAGRSTSPEDDGAMRDAEDTCLGFHPARATTTCDVRWKRGSTPKARKHCQRVRIIDVCELWRVCSRAVQWDTIGKRTANQHGTKAQACDTRVQIAEYPCLV